MAKPALCFFFDEVVGGQKSLDASALIKQKLAALIRGGGADTAFILIPFHFPSSAVVFCSLPSRLYVILTLSPGLCERTAVVTSSVVSIFLSPICFKMSPFFNPAFSAALSLLTDWISAPLPLPSVTTPSIARFSSSLNSDMRSSSFQFMDHVSPKPCPVLKR